MKTLLFLAIFISNGIVTNDLFAQQIAKPFVEQSDPEARKVLHKLRDKYNTYKGNLKAEYTLIIEAGDNKETQHGKILQKGEKFRVTNNGNELICDGKTVWTFMKKQNEVQISTFDPDDDEMISPSKLLKIHELEKEFTYAITGEDASSYSIEFKPNDRRSEYSKMRVKIQKDKMDVENIKVFAKDGSRYNFDIKKVEAATLPDTQFTFDKAQHPGVRETDLRD